MNQLASEITKEIVISMVEKNSLSLTNPGKAGETSSEETNKFAIEQIAKAYKEIYRAVLNP